MVVGRFALDGATGAQLVTALNRWSAPAAGADGKPDPRSAPQRRADALAAALDAALAVQSPRRSERPRVVVHLTPGQLDELGSTVDGLPWIEGGGAVSVAAARRLACDAVLQRLVMEPSLGPLDVGRTVRLATFPQRVALAARDGGCVVPGCGAAPDVCDAHHVVHWADGGPTDIGNLCLLCPAHHTAVHAGTWDVSIDAGTQRVTVTPPAWVDPLRRPQPAWRQKARTTWEQFREDLRRTRDAAPPPSPPPTRSSAGPPQCSETSRPLDPRDPIDVFDAALVASGA